MAFIELKHDSKHSVEITIFGAFLTTEIRHVLGFSSHFLKYYETAES